MSARSSQFRPTVRRLLPWLVAFRFLVNVSLRMMFTFLPAFARGTGLSVEAMGRVLSARDLTSLAAPLAGRAADRKGTTTVMTYAGLLAAGGVVAATLDGVWFVVGMLVSGLGITGFQVGMQAWVGDEVAYARRGRVTGFIELAWGGTALVGLPVMGLLIDAFGWRAPFFVISIASVPVLMRMQKLREPSPTQNSTTSRRPRFSPAVVAALVVNAAMAAAAQFMFLSHGLWLEDTYGLDTTQIGLAIVAVGAIEVTATLFSARLTDTLGKRRSIIAGGTVMTAGMALLGIFPSPPFALGLAMLVLAFLGFEFSIVSTIPLIAELDPNARAQMIAVSLAVTTISRAAITLIAASIYDSSGFASLMTIAAVFGVVAVGLAVTTMVEPANAD